MDQIVLLAFFFFGFSVGIIFAVAAFNLTHEENK